MQQIKQFQPDTENMERTYIGTDVWAGYQWVHHILVPLCALSEEDIRAHTSRMDIICSWTAEWFVSLLWVQRIVEMIIRMKTHQEEKKLIHEEYVYMHTIIHFFSIKWLIKIHISLLFPFTCNCAYIQITQLSLYGQIQPLFLSSSAELLSCCSCSIPSLQLISSFCKVMLFRYSFLSFRGYAWEASHRYCHRRPHRDFGMQVRSGNWWKRADLQGEKTSKRPAGLLENCVRWWRGPWWESACSGATGIASGNSAVCVTKLLQNISFLNVLVTRPQDAPKIWLNQKILKSEKHLI